METMTYKEYLESLLEIATTKTEIDRIKKELNEMYEGLEEQLDIIYRLNDLVKEEYLWSYDLKDNELVVRYGLSSVKDTERAIDLEDKTLKQAFLESAEELRVDIESSLVDNNDYFGYDTKEELEDRITEETEYLKLLSELV